MELTHIFKVIALIAVISIVFVALMLVANTKYERWKRAKKESRLKQNDIVYIHLLNGCCICQIKYIDREERKVHFVNMESIKRDRLITDLNNVIL